MRYLWIGTGSPYSHGRYRLRYYYRYFVRYFEALSTRPHEYLTAQKARAYQAEAGGEHGRLDRLGIRLPKPGT